MKHMDTAKKRRGWRKALALLITLVLVCGLAAPAYAEGDQETTETTQVEQENLLNDSKEEVTQDPPVVTDTNVKEPKDGVVLSDEPSQEDTEQSEDQGVPAEEKPLIDQLTEAQTCAEMLGIMDKAGDDAVKALINNSEDKAMLDNKLAELADDADVGAVKERIEKLSTPAGDPPIDTEASGEEVLDESTLEADWITRIEDLTAQAQALDPKVETYLDAWNAINIGLGNIRDEAEASFEKSAISMDCLERVYTALNAALDVLGDPYQTNTLDIGSVSIVDDVARTGQFQLEATDTSGNPITAKELKDAGYTITWSKNGATVDRTEVTDNVYNLDENGAWVNVVFDKGAQATYTVTVSKEGENEKSAQSKVTYYDALQNPSFEQPTVSRTDGWGGISQMGQGNVPAWSTTAGDSLIEIALVTDYSSTGTSKWYHCNTAVDGKQIAELNATQAGALYQDVLTEPGSTMNWRFAHRGREGADIMALVVANVEDVRNVTTQSQLIDFINTHQNDPNVFITYATDGQAWETYQGTTTVPEGQFVSRFFFVAIDAVGGVSQGNLLDAVWFSTDVPAPIAGTGQITVTKNIYGLTASQVTNANLSDFITYGNGQAVSFSNWSTKTDESGKRYVTSTAVITIDNLSGGQEYNYTFTENLANAEVNGFNVTCISGQTQSVTLTKQDNSKAVTFTNQYTPANTTVTVSKHVTGGLGDKDKDFEFTVTVKQGDANANFTIGETSYTGTATFTLSDGQHVELVVPVGSTVTVTETDYTGEHGGYTTTYTVNNGTKQDGWEAVLTAQVGDNTIAFKNHKEASPDTGVLLDSLPYVLILAAVAVAAVLMFARKRRNRDAD